MAACPLWPQLSKSTTCGPASQPEEEAAEVRQRGATFARRLGAARRPHPTPPLPLHPSPQAHLPPPILAEEHDGGCSRGTGRRGHAGSVGRREARGVPRVVGCPAPPINLAPSQPCPHRRAWTPRPGQQPCLPGVRSARTTPRPWRWARAAAASCSRIFCCWGGGRLRVMASAWAGEGGGGGRQPAV